MICKKSFNVVNAAVVAHDLTEYKHTGDVRTCFLCFVQDGGWFSENVCEIILD